MAEAARVLAGGVESGAGTVRIPDGSSCQKTELAVWVSLPGFCLSAKLLIIAYLRGVKFCPTFFHLWDKFSSYPRGGAEDGVGADKVVPPWLLAGRVGCEEPVEAADPLILWGRWRGML
jgi:hypothetical protein